MYFKSIFADICIGIDSNYETTERFCRKYLAEKEQLEVFKVSATDEEIQAEDDKISEGRFSMNYLETLAILRKIAERFPFYQRILMHGATISFNEKAYMFTALSGTGKTTHIKLWKQFLGDKVSIINGDKPFLWVKDAETGKNEPSGVYAYGSPWAGKENWHRNVSAPLNGICFLKRGTENKIRKIAPEMCLPLLMKQVYLPANAEAAGLTLELLDQMLKVVPLYILECDMSEEAVKVSFEAMTGLNYETYKAEEESEDCSYAN